MHVLQNLNYKAMFQKHSFKFQERIPILIKANLQFRKKNLQSSSIELFKVNPYGKLNYKN